MALAAAVVTAIRASRRSYKAKKCQTAADRSGCLNAYRGWLKSNRYLMRGQLWLISKILSRTSQSR